VFQNRYQSEHIDYYRTVFTDKHLARVLADELKKRITVFGKPNAGSDQVVLISESDTFYGRSLHDTIEKKLSERIPALRIRSFSYFRGLDGQVPVAKSPAKSTNGEGNNGTAKEEQPDRAEKAVDDQEVAEGQGQFDYLRRLADQIHRIDDDIRHQGPGKIAAVGILGSDVYDKQRLIEAIKSELPEAVFFTTDLDALLLPHGKFRSTRNLIVASSYGLKLAPGLQCDIPPFRSTYQSSIFLATRLATQNAPDAEGTCPRAQETRMALNSWVAEPSSGKESDKPTSETKETLANANPFQIARSQVQPLPIALERPLSDKPSSETKDAPTSAKLFQIGRSQVQALPTAEASTSNNRPNGGNSCNITNRDFLKYPSIDPTDIRLFPEVRSGSEIWTGLLIAIIMLAIALIGSRRLRDLCFPRGDRVRPNLGWLIIPTMEIVLVGLWLSASWPWWASLLTECGLGEPMSLFEGVSVWPTVALRAMSIVLAGWLVVYTLDRLKIDIDRLQQEMHLPEPCFRDWERQSPVGRWLIDRLYEMASLLWRRPPKGIEPRGNDAEQTCQFYKLWDTYNYYGQKHWRLVRAVIGTLMMLALWFLLTTIFGGSNVPARGSVAHFFYQWITRFDVLMTLILIFLVVDATLFSRSVVVCLTTIESHWPRDLVKPIKKRLHLDRPDLEEWLDIKFMAGRTRCITQLIYFPFVMLALLMVSRSPIFDNYTFKYTFTPTLVIGQVSILAIIIGSVVSLRHAAEQARKIALDHLLERVAANHDNPSAVSQLESLRNQVREMQEGAFASPLSQPIVKAVLLPLVSYGGTWLVQIYAMPGL
jgi:hypothetical protein